MKNIKLYDTFNHWQDTGAIWLYSDPHFNDPDCKTINPNWPNADEQVKLINSKVNKGDTLIILGDIGDESYVKKLKGYKILITGNHDKGALNYQRVERYPIAGKNWSIEDYKNVFEDFICKASIQPEDLPEDNILVYCDNKMFDEVYTGPLFINNKILLSHEPIDIPFGINVHGHCHNGEQSTYWADTRVKINVCCDVRDFMPVRLDKLLEEFKVTDLHRIIINRAKDNERGD